MAFSLNCFRSSMYFGVKQSLHRLNSCALQKTTLYPTSVLVKDAKWSGDKVTMKVRKQAEKEMVSYWKKNLNSSRPWSPHLQIYKPTLVMTLSLIHRTTGVAMSMAWIGAGYAALAFPGQFPELMHLIASYSFGPGLIFAFKYVLAYPLVFHILNGIRHLYWDNAMGLVLKDAETSGYALIGLSLVLSGLVALLKA